MKPCFFQCKNNGLHFFPKTTAMTKVWHLDGKDYTKVPVDVSFCRLSKPWVRWSWLPMIIVLQCYTHLYHGIPWYHVQLSDLRFEHVWNLVFILTRSKTHRSRTTKITPPLAVCEARSATPLGGWAWNRSPNTKWVVVDGFLFDANLSSEMIIRMDI